MASRLARILALLAALVLALAATAAGIGAAAFAALPLIAEAVPLELARIEMTDGRRRLEMQGMAHLATDRFYGEVAATVARRRAEGWLVLYEEVRNDLGDPRGIAEVLDRLGASWEPGEDGKHPYEVIAPLLGEGLRLQDNRALLGPPGPDARNVDVTLSELLEALPPAAPAEGEAMDLADIRRAFDESAPWIQRRIRAAARLALALSTSGDMARRMLPPAVTDHRERLVADAIRAAPDRDVLILYGQAHLDEIRRRLQQADPAWRVVSESALRAF
jgi:hypothetical protein